MKVIADGLAFPEGPVVMQDGSVIVVEVLGKRITRCWSGRTETVCQLAGAPNGAAIGPDGALWICNNGGVFATGPGSEGRIERVDLSSGKLERVFSACDGITLGAPNDLVFDSRGGLWFTDIGTLHGGDGKITGKDLGGVFHGTTDGRLMAIQRNMISPNGIGISPDETSLYVADTFQARLYRYALEGREQKPELVGVGIGDVGFDSLALTHDGNICIATLMAGGITTFSPDGQVDVFSIPEDHAVTNIAFGGDDMKDAYITLSATGQLVCIRWAEPGLRLAFSA